VEEVDEEMVLPFHFLLTIHRQLYTIHITMNNHHRMLDLQLKIVGYGERPTKNHILPPPEEQEDLQQPQQ
jgi:hypothetical protein